MTHYETLGVTRDGSDAELRTAYRTRARQLHPDLRRDRSPAERIDDDHAMQHLNDAWHVLSDPDRRRRYDRSLDELRVTVRRVETAADRPQVYVDEATGPSRAVPVMALLGAVLVCTTVVAFVFVHDTSGQTSFKGVNAVTTGDCVTVRSGHVSEIVPCHSPNDGQVASVIPRGQPCAATQRLVDGPIGGSTFVCLGTAARP